MLSLLSLVLNEDNNQLVKKPTLAYICPRDRRPVADRQLERSEVSEFVMIVLGQKHGRLGFSPDRKLIVSIVPFIRFGIPKTTSLLLPSVA